VIRTWAPADVKVEKRECLSHHEVLARIDGYDPERGVKIVGHRGYCLTGYGLFLNLALVNYGLEFLFNKGYKPNQPPHFMLRDAMAKTAQLEQFDEELYKVTESEDKSTDKYLIATSEQPLSGLHDSEWLQEKELPIKYILPYSAIQTASGDVVLTHSLDMQDTAHAIEKRLARMERMRGVFSECISSKR
jgi:seryl-tRNA synthetase